MDVATTVTADGHTVYQGYYKSFDRKFRVKWDDNKVITFYVEMDGEDDVKELYHPTSFNDFVRKAENIYHLVSCLSDDNECTDRHWYRIEDKRISKLADLLCSQKLEYDATVVVTSQYLSPNTKSPSCYMRHPTYEYFFNVAGSLADSTRVEFLPMSPEVRRKIDDAHKEESKHRNVSMGRLPATDNDVILINWHR